MTAEEIVHRLEGKRNGSGWMARCPSHEDAKASLSITEGREGRVLLRCHAGCDLQSVLLAMGLGTGDLFPDTPTKRPAREIVATYDYHDEAGALLYQVVRFHPKDFRQRRPDPEGKDGFTWSMKGVRRVLYRLPAVVKAVQEEWTVYIVEGEKDADKLREAELVATCNVGGAGKWATTYTETLRGAVVVIIADKDQPGRDHAEKVASALHGVAKSMKVVELPDLGGKAVKDVSDFFAAGGDAFAFEAITDAAEKWKPSSAVKTGSTAAEYLSKEEASDEEGKEPDIDTRLSGRWFDPHKPPPDEPVLITIAGVPCATPGNLTTLTAQKKSGKTAFLSGILAASISEHGDTLGVTACNPEGKTVLHFDTEQSAMDHWRLCDSILRRAQLNESAIFKSVCLTGLTIHDRRQAVHHIIRKEAEQGGVFIAVIDGHGDLIRNVNDPEAAADYVAGLHALAIETRCHIFGALHLNPGSDFKSRGHLGSELERKSQTNLRVEKTEEQFCAWGDANRGAPITKTIGPCFQWSDDARMHVSIPSRMEGKNDEAKEKVQEAFRLADKTGLYYSDLVAALKRVPGVRSNSTAERIFRQAKAAGFVTKNLLNQWAIAA